MTPAEVLNRAADLIEQGGHCKGRYRDWHAFCASGAVMHAASGVTEDHYFEAMEALISATGGNSVSEWNDAPERTTGEVVAKIREAAQTVTA